MTLASTRLPGDNGIRADIDVSANTDLEFKEYV